MSMNTVGTRETDSYSRPGVRNPAVLAWLRLARVFQKVDRLSHEKFRCRALSMAQFDVLATVGTLDGPTQQELADALLVTKGNVCQILDRMETSGLLVRQQEGRSNRLFLTDAGKSLFSVAVPEHEHVIDQAFHGLTPEEQGQLLALLRKLDRSLA
jgi:DNA-binding MarR family transcriptional regulator